MASDDIYFDMVDTSKVSSIQQAMAEAEKLKRIDDFRMQQQLDSPVYKKLVEQNNLLIEQSGKLSKQNKILAQQLTAVQEGEKNAKKEARVSKMFGYISFAVGTLIGVAGLVIALFALFK